MDYNNNYYSPRQHNFEKGRMRLNGLGVLKVEPDIAIVTMGVITEDKNLEKAQKENAIRTNRVIEGLKSIGINEEDISTSSYNIEPQYDFVEGRQKFRGYKVSNILNVKVRDINKVGEVVDKAVQSGANSVSNIKFTAENIDSYYNKALKLAITDVVLKAVEVSNTLNVQLNRTPVSIVEKSLREVGESTIDLKAYSASTPIVPGEINVVARIEAVFCYY
ncbi:SIMPL domain-containing protein [uncultured Clostridium sp.]|uniref:SIMPL domain-containing protein n=1 Tax=uncultured Clostridium sp. TaxID=59620 RepID=UPI0028E34611|nr:SIMPL domain-containing protein [uncultured Clostridium sp.]